LRRELFMRRWAPNVTVVELGRVAQGWHMAMQPAQAEAEAARALQTIVPSSVIIRSHQEIALLFYRGVGKGHLTNFPDAGQIFAEQDVDKVSLRMRALQTLPNPSVKPNKASRDAAHSLTKIREGTRSRLKHVPCAQIAQDLAALSSQMDRTNETEDLYLRALHGFIAIFRLWSRPCQHIISPLAELRGDQT